MNLPAKRLRKTNVSDAYITGVCGGLAKYIGIDATVLRVITAVGTIFTGFFPVGIAYVVASFLMPREYDI